ncbi:hypothetical protein JSO54_09005 [Riemerella anatipestifer]|uniref:hypothetical protein n=1 Tax=Riemerella anatipestifer TaxID=34085 RepID=UPI0013749C6D|nr:hypothetical protein [Riemerella anatipestifer]
MNECSKCGKRISYTETKCKACKRSLWTNIKDGAKTLGGAAGGGLATALALLKIIEIFNKKK